MKTNAHILINRAVPVLVAMLAFNGATALAQGNDALFDAPWRSFDTGDFPTYIPEFFDVGDIDGDGDPGQRTVGAA